MLGSRKFESAFSNYVMNGPLKFENFDALSLFLFNILTPPPSYATWIFEANKITSEWLFLFRTYTLSFRLATRFSASHYSKKKSGPKTKFT